MKVTFSSIGAAIKTVELKAAPGRRRGEHHPQPAIPFQCPGPHRLARRRYRRFSAPGQLPQWRALFLRPARRREMAADLHLRPERREGQRNERPPARTHGMDFRQTGPPQGRAAGLYPRRQRYADQSRRVGHRPARVFAQRRTRGTDLRSRHQMVEEAALAVIVQRPVSRLRLAHDQVPPHHPERLQSRLHSSHRNQNARREGRVFQQDTRPGLRCAG